MALDSEGDGGCGEEGVYFRGKMERDRKWVPH